MFSRVLYRLKLFQRYHNITLEGVSALEFYFWDYWPGSSLSKLLLKPLLTPCQTRCCIFNAAPAEGTHQIFVSSSVEQRCTYTCWITQRPLSGRCPASSGCHRRLQWRKVGVQGRPSIRPRGRRETLPPMDFKDDECTRRININPSINTGCVRAQPLCESLAELYLTNFTMRVNTVRLPLAVNKLEKCNSCSSFWI